MRHLIKYGLILSFTLSTPAYSLNPVEGFYFGILGQISHAPNTQLNFTLDQPYSGTVELGPVGGGAGAAIGYKIYNVRLEGEFLFNFNNYGELQLGPCTLVSPTVVSPKGVCPAFIADNGLGFKGDVMGFYGLFNVIYDFLLWSDPNITYYPYLGFGLGAATIRNNAIIENNKYASVGVTPVSFNQTVTNSGFAAQGIFGIGAYLDDFTTIGLDYRYVSTFGSNQSSSNNHFGISTLNFTATFALERDK